MKLTKEMVATLLILFTVGCSGISNVERAELTDVESREYYIEQNPNSLFCENIKNGEIVRGMNIYEVLASWGLPNVYLVGRRDPRENWIYYVEDMDTRSILIYTLTFHDNLLETWDIDMKRFIDQRIVYEDDALPGIPARKIWDNPKRQ